MSGHSSFKYEIVISGDIPESLHGSIISYWAFGKDYFKHSLETLKNSNNGIAFPMKKVLENSHVELTLSKCELCSNEIRARVNNREEFLDCISVFRRVCDRCKSFSPNYSQSTRARIPIETRLEELSPIELKVLNGIVTLKSKKLIYRHIFNNEIEDSRTWKIINLLQRKGLVWIERDDSWKIRSFEFRDDLPNFLESHLSK